MLKEFTLNNGVKVPAVGYGTFLSTENNGGEVLRSAVEAGYRYFDTASFYGNEAELGKVLDTSGLRREDFQIGSKLWRTEMGYEQAKKAFLDSITRLRTDYLDVYMIHWPKQENYDETWKEVLRNTWRAMEELYQEGKIRALGLSNFLPHHLDVILDSAKINPALNQLELHVGYMQSEAVEYSKKNGIQVQAWSPLGRQRVINEPVVLRMAEKYGLSPAQFLLGFLNRQGIMVLPKASDPERMKMNMQLDGFEISKEDMQFLKCLPQMGWSGEHPDFV